MQELTVIGVEKGALLAASEDGARFRIEMDEVLQSRLRQVQPESRSGPKLSPREIQSQIRSGLSAEDVAQLTGASVEDIQRYEGPVIAEREHIVTSALAVPVHTASADPADDPSSFGAAMRERLADLGATGERWASWKDEDRGWMVKLEFTSDSVDHDARWAFDPRAQSLQPINTEAVALSRHRQVVDRLVPRLRAVAPEHDDSRFDSGAFTLDSPGQDDTAPQLEPLPYGRPAVAVSSPAATRAAIKRADEPAPAAGETADLLEALRRRRGEREAASDDHERMPQPAERTVDAPREPVMAPAGAALPEPEPVVDDQPGTAARSLWGGKASASATRAKRGRAAMPSWDEIVFGARPDDDLA